MSDDKPIPIDGDKPKRFPRQSTKRMFKDELKKELADGKLLGEARESAAQATLEKHPVPEQAGKEIARAQKEGTREVVREMTADYADKYSRLKFHQKMWEWLEGTDKEKSLAASKILSKGLIASQANINIKTDPYENRTDDELQFYIQNGGKWPEECGIVLHAPNQRVN